MKKTLITLLALGGVAMAYDGTYLNSVLNDAITLSGYTEGTSYSITWDISDLGAVNYSNKKLLTLADSYYLIAQYNGGNAGQRYFGLSTQTGDAPAPANYTFATSTVGDITTKTLTSTDGMLPLSWITRNDDGTSSQWRELGSVVTLTLEYDNVANNSALTLSYAGTNTVDKVIFTGTEIKLTDVGFHIGTTGDADGSVTIGGSTYLIPEPATATLSLLALAGLAVRRRRK